MAIPATLPTDIKKIREEFPVLSQKVNGRDLVYFDNAATSQKPRQVIQALIDYFQSTNANVYRGIQSLAERAMKAYEAAREVARAFMRSDSSEVIIFVRGVIEAINLVVSSYGRAFLREGVEVIIS